MMPFWLSSGGGVQESRRDVDVSVLTLKSFGAADGAVCNI